MRDRSLECPICLHQYSDPRVLGCGHSFCLDCLSKSAKETLWAPCPVCNQVSKIPTKQGVTQLPKNYALGSAVESQRKRVPCSECKEPVLKQRLFFCPQDQVILCSACMLVDHDGHNSEPLNKWQAKHFRAQVETAVNKLDNLLPLAEETVQAADQSSSLLKLTEVLPLLFRASFHPVLDSLLREHTLTAQLPAKLQERLDAIQNYATSLTEKLSQLTKTILETLNSCSRDISHLLTETFPDPTAIDMFNGMSFSGLDLSDAEWNLIVSGSAVDAVAIERPGLFSQPKPTQISQNSFIRDKIVRTDLKGRVKVFKMPKDIATSSKPTNTTTKATQSKCDEQKNKDGGCGQEALKPKLVFTNLKKQYTQSFQNTAKVIGITGYVETRLLSLHCVNASDK